MPTLSIEMANERYNLRYDIEAMLEVETLIQTLNLGTNRADFFQMLDPPYNVREMVVLIQAGINGYKRFQGETNAKNFTNTDEVRRMVQAHFDAVQKKAKSVQAWRDAQAGLWSAIAKAARMGVGLVEEEKSDKGKKEKDDPSPNEENGSPGAII